MSVAEKPASDVDANVVVENEDAKPGEESKYEVSLEEALKLAKAHHKSGNLAIAERTYRDILRAVPDHYPTVYFLAALSFQRGNNDDAIKYGKMATEQDPDNASCWINYASAISVADRHEEAIEFLDRALALDPEAYEAYTNKSYALWLLDRFEEAEETALQASMINPDKPDAYMNLGIALASQKKYEEAAEIWQQLAEMQPESAKVYSNWSNTLRQQGHLEQAKEKAEKAIELDPSNPDAYNNLGCVYKDMGDNSEALECYKKATNAEPDYYVAHDNIALTHLAAQRYEDAMLAARYAVSFKKDNASSYDTLATAQMHLGLLNEARESADRAVILEPNNPMHYLVLADVMTALGNSDEADAILNQALALDPADVRTLLKLSEVRVGLDLLDEAIEAIDQAIEVFQETPPILIQKARVLERANRVEDGLEVIERALAMRPNSPHALLTKADLLLTINRKKEAAEVLESKRDLLKEMPAYYYSIQAHKKFSEDDSDFIKLKEILDKADSYDGEVQALIHFAMSQAYEKMGSYDEAFEHLAKACDVKLSTRVFDKHDQGHAFQMRKSQFTKEAIEAHKGKGYDSDVPVFILGMPRSGTTLTEQIISSHPDVYGAGELYDLNAVVREMGPLTPDNAEQMGRAYVEKATARDKSGKAVRVTDKMPGNYMSVGLIDCILPNAKIIHTRRNPIDNCLSCFKQNFATGHDYSYDLEGLAIRYRLYDDLMKYWHKVLPEGRILDIDYEYTVNNFEEQARKLIDFVGLEWNDACLEPHKQKRAVLTASKDQVNKPIYKSSVDAWKRYEKGLQPLIDGLRPILEERGIEV